MAKRKRIISMNVLSGEPLDGTGRVCIHLFVQDAAGPFVEPHALHPVFDENGRQVKQQVTARPTRGRLACDPKRNAVPCTRNGVTVVTHRTADPHAVTCPGCKASRDYAEMMAKISALAAQGGE